MKAFKTALIVTRCGPYKARTCHYARRMGSCGHRVQVMSYSNTDGKLRMIMRSSSSGSLRTGRLTFPYSVTAATSARQARVASHSRGGL